MRRAGSRRSSRNKGKQCSSRSFQHQRRSRLGASYNPRNPRPRMRPRTDEIEVRDMIVAIMDAEPGALGQDRLEAEGAAEMRVQILGKILRRIMEFGHDPLMDVGDQPPPHLVEDALFED